MGRLNRYKKKLFLSGLSGWTWLSLSGLAWAQEEGGGGGGNYVFPYFLVVVGISAGLAVALNPSRRRDKARPDEYVEKKLV